MIRQSKAEKNDIHTVEELRQYASELGQKDELLSVVVGMTAEICYRLEQIDKTLVMLAR